MGRKWNNIKYKKAAKDLNTSRIYAKFGREIYVAAKQESLIGGKSGIKMVLEKAKTYDVRNILLTRHRKSKGGSDEDYDELRYEGFGPGGSMIIVDALTNNVNRTASEVRAAFGKNGGNMGVSGSVSYMFDSTAVIGLEGKSEEEVLELLMEAEIDVRDVFEEDGAVIIYAEPHQFHQVQEVLRNAGVKEFTVAELTMLPQNEVTLEGETLAAFEKLIDALEDLEDVKQVYHNVNLDD